VSQILVAFIDDFNVAVASEWHAFERCVFGDLIHASFSFILIRLVSVY